MKKRPLFIIAILVPIIIFLITIAYWTVLPRTATLDITGEGIYTGQLRGMTFHGYGTYESYVVGGTSYEGEWVNGVYHGKGTLTFANGSKLVGEFIDGSIHGIGKSICPDGHVTEVDFGEGTVIKEHDCDHDH